MQLIRLFLNTSTSKHHGHEQHNKRVFHHTSRSNALQIVTQTRDVLRQLELHIFAILRKTKQLFWNFP